MAGLFGGAQRFLAANRGAGNFAERLALFGAQMQDVGDGGDRARSLISQRAAADAMAQKQEALGRLNGLFGGAQPTPSLDINALSQGNLGPTDAERAAMPQQPRGLPSLQQAAPALLGAMRAGVDIGDYVALLDKTGPDMAVDNGVAYDRRNIQPGQRIGVNLSNINGHAIDMQDPANANRFVPQVGEGQRLLYDERGNPVIQNIDGYTQAIAQTTGAKSAAESASSAPYQLNTVMGPDGRTVTASRAQILGGGPIYGQSAADREYDVVSARNRAEQEDKREDRASAAVRMLPTLDRMESLLPDIISGQGADWRRAGARFAGTFMGNEDAARRAASTEVFQNEARQVVSQIIGTFGANPTEGERKYAEQMAGADVNLTPQALAEGIRLARARAQRDIAAQNGGGDRAARAREILRQRGRTQ